MLSSSPVGSVAHICTPPNEYVFVETVRTRFKDGVECRIEAADIAGINGLNSGYCSRNRFSRLRSTTAHRTCNRRCAPSADQRIGYGQHDLIS
jgi:hypothetical protein